MLLSQHFIYNIIYFISSQALSQQRFFFKILQIYRNIRSYSMLDGLCTAQQRISQCPGRYSRVAFTSLGWVDSGRMTVYASLLLTLESRQMILMPTSRQFSRAMIWIWSASLSICSTSVWQKNSMGISFSMKVSQRTALFLSSPEVRKRIISTRQLEMEGSQNIAITSSRVFNLMSSSFSMKSYCMSSKMTPSNLAFSRYSLASFSFFTIFSLRAVSLRTWMASKMEKVSALQKQLPSLRVLRYWEQSLCRFWTLMQNPSLLTNSSSMSEMGRSSLMRGDSASIYWRICSCCSWWSISWISYSLLSLSIQIIL